MRCSVLISWFILAIKCQPSLCVRMDDNEPIRQASIGATGEALVSNAKTKPFNVRLLLVRHAFSCGNALFPGPKEAERTKDIDSMKTRIHKMLGQALQRNITPEAIKLIFPQQHGQPMKVTFNEGTKTAQTIQLNILGADPPLTETAKMQSVQAGGAFFPELNGKVHMIYSSPLQRSLQTANYMILPNKKSLHGNARTRGVFPVPFISEKKPSGSFHFDNTLKETNVITHAPSLANWPESELELQSYFGFLKSLPSFSRFKAFFALFLFPEQVLNRAAGSADEASKAIQVLKEIETNFAEEGFRTNNPPMQYKPGPSSSENVSRQALIESADTFTVIVVSHSQFMKEMCAIDETPENNAVLELWFSWQSESSNGTEVVTLTQLIPDGKAKPCQTVLETPKMMQLFLEYGDRGDWENCRGCGWDGDLELFLDSEILQRNYRYKSPVYNTLG